MGEEGGGLAAAVDFVGVGGEYFAVACEEDREGVDGEVSVALALEDGEEDEDGECLGGGVGEGGVGGRGPCGVTSLVSIGGGSVSGALGTSAERAEVEEDACEREGARN